MIPNGDDWRIRKALGYMPASKVLSWARATICPNINERDINRIERDMPKGDGRRIGTAADAQAGLVAQTHLPTCNGSLPKRIDAYIAAKSKECGVSAAHYRRVLGWR